MGHSTSNQHKWNLLDLIDEKTHKTPPEQQWCEQNYLQLFPLLLLADPGAMPPNGLAVTTFYTEWSCKLECNLIASECQPDICSPIEKQPQPLETFSSLIHFNLWYLLSFYITRFIVLVISYSICIANHSLPIHIWLLYSFWHIERYRMGWGDILTGIIIVQFQRRTKPTHICIQPGVVK